MTKLLKCPNCNKHLHTLSSRMLCTKFHSSHVDEDGNIVETESWTVGRGLVSYECSLCGFITGNRDLFISDFDCDCEHDETEWESDNEYQYAICTRCGAIDYSERVEDDGGW